MGVWQLVFNFVLFIFLYLDIISLCTYNSVHMEIKDVINQLVAPYYTRKNLELVLGSNRRTLDYRLSKLVSVNILEKIRPGFYLNKKLLSASPQKEEVLEYVGNVAKYPSYVSLEYALSKYGLIPEAIYTITYVTTKKTGKYFASSASFSYRNIKSELFYGYEERDFGGGKYLFALNFKALFDLFYLTPCKTQSEMKQMLYKSRINWKILSPQDISNLINTCNSSNSMKMKQVAKLIEKGDAKWY